MSVLQWCWMCKQSSTWLCHRPCLLFINCKKWPMRLPSSQRHVLYTLDPLLYALVAPLENDSWACFSCSFCRACLVPCTNPGPGPVRAGCTMFGWPAATLGQAEVMQKCPCSQARWKRRYRPSLLTQAGCGNRGVVLILFFCYIYWLIYLINKSILTLCSSHFLWIKQDHICYIIFLEIIFFIPLLMQPTKHKFNPTYTNKEKPAWEEKHNQSHL
jgi:hypothetical protein